jgi:putative flippase GtrA
MWQKLQRIFVPQEMAKYIVAGGFGFVVDVAILFTLTEYLGVHYLVSGTFGFSVGLVISYWLNIKWVFGHRKFEQQVQTEFTAFTGIVVTGFLIHQLVMWISVETLGIGYMLAKVGAAFFVLAFNFLAKKFLLFSPQSNK